MSMNPGASTRSSASTVRAAAAPERDPIAAMRAPDTPTSARYQAPPLPSTIRAPRTSRSNGSGGLAADAPAIATETRLAAARSAFRPGAMCCPERRLMLSEVYGIRRRPLCYPPPDAPSHLERSRVAPGGARRFRRLPSRPRGVRAKGLGHGDGVRVALSRPAGGGGGGPRRGGGRGGG